ncbi:hypothetical protein [Pedobacter sp. Hv1]|uniref:HYC_CC_PP family protein n=1 Tax=Pedobacter sp. Hv1 TaxID=1740090 RepID=UPI0006D8CD28|nr:hypothetical protein [Pedobacter sp. Hv1]KQC00850.1 hypothetical protein AQF98_09240 [Pedobacter sp. Hv1]
MKRALFTFLAIFYLSVSSGATVHFHYCMGQLVKLSLNQPQKDNCGVCGMSKKEVKKHSCCKDDYKQAKVDTSKKTAQTVYQFNAPVVAVDQQYGAVTDPIVLSSETNKAVYGHSPPESECVPIFIRNCTYRI